MNPESLPAGTTNATTLSRPKRKHDPVDLLVFIIPFSQFVQIRMIGVLTGTDLLFILTFLYLAIQKKIKLSSPYAKKFFVLCLLWLASQVVTDIVRQSMLIKIARSWSSISITLFGFVVLVTLLYGRPRRIVLYGWGFVVGSIIGYYVAPSDFQTDYPWKFGFGFPVTLGVILIASRKEFRGQWSILLCTMIGIVNVIVGARSLGEFCLGAALYIFVTRDFRKKESLALKLKTKTKVAVAVSVVVGFGGIIWAYQYAAGHGMLGEEAQSKLVAQSSGKYGVLLGGRTEMLGSIPAIYDSPIIGHGSQPSDPKYLLIMQASLAALGYDQVAEGFDETYIEGSGAIPTHSYLFGAWVWAGVLGAVFWGWIWILTVRALVRVYPDTLLILPLMAYCAFQMLWDILFSPYGTYSRIIVPYFVVILMSCLGIAPRRSVKTLSRPGTSRPRLRDSEATT